MLHALHPEILLNTLARERDEKSAETVQSGATGCRSASPGGASTDRVRSYRPESTSDPITIGTLVRDNGASGSEAATSQIADDFVGRADAVAQLDRLRHAAASDRPARPTCSARQGSGSRDWSRDRRPGRRGRDAGRARYGFRRRGASALLAVSAGAAGPGDPGSGRLRPRHRRYAGSRRARRRFGILDFAGCTAVLAVRSNRRSPRGSVRTQRTCRADRRSALGGRGLPAAARAPGEPHRRGPPADRRDLPQRGGQR